MADDRLSTTEEAILLALKSDSQTIPQYLEYEAPALNEKEWLRYSGIPTRDHAVMKEDPLFVSAMGQTRAMASKECSYRVGFLVAPIAWGEDGYPVLPFPQKSDILRQTLLGCSKVVLFAATVGSGIDRLIRRYEKAEPRMGLLLQGHGAERVESLCDLFNQEVENAARKLNLELADGEKATARRYSPGYGDLSIEVQRDFLPLLDAQRRMGITLSESCLMAPSKSVTAIIGVK